jgi:hypothetical protein
MWGCPASVVAPSKKALGITGGSGCTQKSNPNIVCERVMVLSSVAAFNPKLIRSHLSQAYNFVRSPRFTFQPDNYVIVVVWQPAATRMKYIILSATTYTSYG